MRKLLNVLYVTTSDSYLSLENNNVVISVENKKKIMVPIHNLESIVCFGYLGVSPALMGFCAENGVGLCFLNQYGKFLARVTGPVYGNVLLRKEQYRVSLEESECVDIAINCIIGKLINTRTVIERAIRDYGERINVFKLKKVSMLIKNSINALKESRSLEEIRGIEGDCAKIYFEIFNKLIVKQKKSFYMNGRNKRPPMDNMNALLSFLYTILSNDIKFALETVGLDPYVGFLHKDRPGRVSLALDIMEEFRAFFVDRIALSLINRKQITEKGFIKKESGGIIMDDDTKKIVLTAWQNRKQDDITHPFLNEKVKIGLLPYIQSLLFSRFLRGDIDAYPPFLWR